MKITVWIRPANEGRNITLRTDTKLESLDTPVIQNFGRKLEAAIKGTAGSTDK